MAPTSNMRNVRLAAENLRQALDLPEDQRAHRVREAKDWLISAADQQGTESAAAREQYFSAPTSASQTTQSAAEALAAIVADAQVGNTLIAAGHALKEVGTGASPAVLDDAILALQSTPNLAGQMVTSMNFVGDATKSPDLPAATSTFRSRVDSTLTDMIKEAHAAGGKVVEEISKVDAGKALEAIGKLGGPLARLPDMGVLIKKGIDKLQQAVDSLMRLLDKAGLGEVKDKLTGLWTKISDGTLVDSLLAWCFGDEAIKAGVAKATSLQNLQPGAFDRASDLLPPLSEGFKNKMAWAKTLTGVIAAGVGLLLFAGLIAAGPLAAFTAGAYLLILAAILVIGRDYAGSGGVFHEGKGVRGVVESIAA